MQTEPEVLTLQTYAQQSGLEPTVALTLAEAFKPAFVKARAALSAAAGVAESVKDATCVKEIKKSRECRLALRAVRIEGEKIHKAQKESALRFGKAVDGFRNILLADIVPVEEALQNAEDTAERAEAARLAALKAQREAELAPLLDGAPILADLSALTPEAFAKLLEDHRLLKQAKIDAAAKAEAERLAKESEARRVAAENERLKQEALAREAAAKAEREAAERALAKAKAEADRLSAIAEQQRLELEAKAKAEAERAAKARAELAAKLKAEAAARAKAEAEEQARIKAARDAAAAPDRAKGSAFVAALRATEPPSLTNADVKAAIAHHLSDCADAIEEECARL